MDDFTFYFGNGWNHIVSIDALDHLLFLIALTAVYSISNWKKVAVLVTAFTIGHSITLALSVYDVLRFDTGWVEFLIPLTIAATCLFNIVRGDKKQAIMFLYLITLLFGFIHGMGFANTLRFMLAREQSIALPLLGFNIGIELAQILVVLILLAVQYILVSKAKLPGKWWANFLSIAAGLAALYMCIIRWPL